MRSAGSKSQIDLIAIPKFSIDSGEEPLLIQCKYGAKISKKELDNLNALWCEIRCSVMIKVAWAKPNKPIIFQDING